jgi:hypothetical protein
MAVLTAWASFYVITGSSAGALTGLTFVVISLVRDIRRQVTGYSVATYTTPVIVHFCEVLLVSATMSAPWPALALAALTVALSGVGGFGYTCIVTKRFRKQLAPDSEYRPVLEDWLFHVVLPLLGYGAVIVAAILLPANPVPALFAIGAVMLLLLFVGIHNAWDTVTFIATGSAPQGDESKE